MKNTLSACLLLAAATVILYLPAAGYDFVGYDDPGYVTGNVYVRAGLTWKGIGWAFTTTRVGNWVPLTWLSHMAAAGIFGLDPGRHHLVNILLHAAGALLLFLALKGMTGSPWLSWAAAALFALHPLHVESVAWIAERKDVLYGVFWTAAMLAYLGYARRPGWGRYLETSLLYVLALLAKPMAVTLPAALLILDYWPLNRLGVTGRRDRDRGGFLGRPLVEKSPWLLLAAAYGAATLVSQSKVGAIAADTYPAAARLANVLVSYADYIVKAAWPAGLSVFYPHPGTSLPAWRVVFSALALAIITLMAWRFRHRFPWALSGWLWYAVTLLPVIGLVQVGDQAMADRYTYLTLTGIFWAAAWGACAWARGRSRREAAAAAAAVVVLLAMAGVARHQLAYWRSTEALFGRALEVMPGNWFAWFAMGNEASREGDDGRAIARYESALRGRPEALEVSIALAGKYAARGRRDMEIQVLRRAVTAAPSSPRAKFLLARALINMNETGAAAALLEEALRLRPGYVDALYDLGVLREIGGDPERAAALYREVLRLAPGHAGAMGSLGFLLLREGRAGEAAAYLERAVRLRPGDLRLRRALDEAIKMGTGLISGEKGK